MLNKITTLIDYMLIGIAGFTLLGLAMRLFPDLTRWGILVGIIGAVSLTILWDYKPARPYIVCIGCCLLLSLLFVLWDLINL